MYLFITLDNTLHHNVISNAIKYDDQLSAYNIDEQFHDNNFMMKFSTKHLDQKMVMHMLHNKHFCL